jgi:copper chaperone
MNQVKYLTWEGLHILLDSIEEANFKTSCGCCGTSQTIKITRSKKVMNEATNNQKTTTVTAPEIVCGGCANSIKKAFGNVEGVSNVEIDVPSKKVTVNHSAQVSRDEIVEVLDRAGYSAE